MPRGNTDSDLLSPFGLIMPRYLLPCSGCQAPLSVGIAQAGSTAPCPKCGKSVEIPGTRQLRLLPLEANSKEGDPRHPGRKGGVSLIFRLVLATLLVLGSTSFLYGSWLAYERWAAPIEFGHTEDEIYQRVYGEAMKEPIIRSWEHWNYLVESGLSDGSEPMPYFIYNRYYEARKPWMIGSLITGAVTLAGFLCLSFFGFRRAAT